ncbi:MAG: TlpA disulfide reductase family protein [Victivallales bacterium]|nr:TlpA disulfide reductase family protein [Victivallales bacterium]
MYKTLLILLAAGLFAFSAPALQTGQNAVKLQIREWLKNGPVALDFGKKVPEEHKQDLYILVMWGTWSPACRNSVPMLCYLRNKYKDKNLQIIAISREQTAAVEKFLEEYPQINYAVAIDDKSLTTLTYLGESRLLPRIYIINVEGQIIWDGEVADLAMILKKIYRGGYSIDIQREVSRLQQNLEVSLRSGNINETIETSNKILRLDPENGFAVRMRMFIYENEHQFDKSWDFINERIRITPDNTMLYFLKLDFVSRFSQYSKYAAPLAEEIYRHFNNDAQMLNNMAWGMLTKFPFDGKVLSWAAACAQRALELAAQNKTQKAFYTGCLNTMALVYYRCGMPQKALETQHQVSRLATGKDARTSSDRAAELYQAAVDMSKKLSSETASENKKTQ